MVFAVLELFERLSSATYYDFANLLQSYHPLFTLCFYVRLSHVLRIAPTDEFIVKKHMARFRSTFFSVLNESCTIHHILICFSDGASL